MVATDTDMGLEVALAADSGTVALVVALATASVTEVLAVLVDLVDLEDMVLDTVDMVDMVGDEEVHFCLAAHIFPKDCKVFEFYR